MPDILFYGKPIWEHPRFKPAQDKLRKQHKCACHLCVLKVLQSTQEMDHDGMEDLQDRRNMGRD